jgi:hypothetical protein
MNPDDPYCFLITSFSNESELLVARAEGINPATERFGFPTYRIDEIPSQESVIEATRHHIAAADFVIADLTGSRPNCYYEVGYAHALGRPVIQIIREGENAHFNLAGHQLLRYRSPEDLQSELKRHILTHILSTRGESDDDEDNKGKFGRRSFVDPYIVTGRVRVNTRDAIGKLTFVVDLRVRSVDPRRPLKGRVVFQLHRSFAQSRYTFNIDEKDGEAWLTDILSFGTFTVGVTIEQNPKDVQLEIDLSSLPGAGNEFRSR